MTSAQTPHEDFALRLRLPQTEVPPDLWNHPCFGRFGPCPLTYPKVQVLLDSGQDPIRWAQERLLAAAQLYLGLPYAHCHIPAMGGLDCSNFTAWTYNFAFGLRFSSNVETQSLTAGRRLDPEEALAPGDLLFFWDQPRKRISHVGLYGGSGWVLDAAKGGVQWRTLEGPYLQRWAWTRRVLEPPLLQTKVLMPAQ